MVVAYLRVSTDKQHLDNKKQEIRRYAAKRGITIDRWVEETISGTKDQKLRKLGGLLKRLKKDDTLIVSEISRLSRRLLEIMGILNTCIRKGVIIHSVKEGYELSDNINSKIITMAFGIVSEVERNLISSRTKEALANKKAQGIILGRPQGSSPKMDILEKNSEVITKLLDNKIPYVQIARLFDVSIGTLCSYVKKLKNSP